jgi:hypothetical protein
LTFRVKAGRRHLASRNLIWKLSARTSDQIKRRKCYA